MRPAVLAAILFSAGLRRIVGVAGRMGGSDAPGMDARMHVDDGAPTRMPCTSTFGKRAVDDRSAASTASSSRSFPPSGGACNADNDSRPPPDPRERRGLRRGRSRSPTVPSTTCTARHSSTVCSDPRGRRVGTPVCRSIIQRSLSTRRMSRCGRRRSSSARSPRTSRRRTTVSVYGIGLRARRCAPRAPQRQPPRWPRRHRAAVDTGADADVQLHEPDVLISEEAAELSTAGARRSRARRWRRCESRRP